MVRQTVRPRGSRIRWLLGAALAFASATAADSVSADSWSDNGRLHWDEDVPRFRPAEYVATGILGSTAIAMYFWLPPQSTPRWTGGIAFDDSVRGALRVRSPDALRTVWALSDGVDVALVALAFGLDSLAVPALRGSPDLALQLGLMDAEAYAYSSILAIGLYDSVGRARPSYADCRRDPSFPGCNISPTASFPSGHTNEAFSAAGVSCANHTFVPIYGGRFWDELACARDVALAAADGVLRVVGDRHYTTDVMTGAAIGFAFGFGVPTLLHYGASSSTKGGGSRSAGPTWTVSPMSGSGPGLAVAGRF